MQWEYIRVRRHVCAVSCWKQNLDLTLLNDVVVNSLVDSTSESAPLVTTSVLARLRTGGVSPVNLRISQKALGFILQRFPPTLPGER